MACSVLVAASESCARALRRIELERRNADALAFLQPVLAVGALAVDAQLAFANDALDVGERKPRKARLEEAVDAHVVLVGGNDDGLDLGRQRRRLGDDLLGLRHERLCRTGRRSRKPRRRLATRTKRLRPLGWRAPIGPRALGAIACWAERFLDATAHGCCGSGVKRLRSAKAANRHGENGTNWPRNRPCWPKTEETREYRGWHFRDRRCWPRLRPSSPARLPRSKPRCRRISSGNCWNSAASSIRRRRPRCSRRCSRRNRTRASRPSAKSNTARPTAICSMCSRLRPLHPRGRC